MSRRKSVSIWYPEYPGDYGRKTAHLSLAEHGAFLLLRQHYYSTGRPLPTNVGVLYRICRAFEGAERAAVDAVVAEFFTPEPDGYHNGRCDDELARRGDIREKRKAAVAARADRQATSAHTSAPTIVATVTVTSTVEEREAKASLGPRKRGKRKMCILEDAVLSEKQRAAAYARGLSGAEAEAQFAKFRNWAIAKGQTYADWDAAWRNWLTSDFFKPALTTETAHGRASRSDQRLDSFLRGAAG